MAIQLRDRYVKPAKAKVNRKKKTIIFNCPPIPTTMDIEFNINDWNAMAASIGISGVLID